MDEQEQTIDLKVLLSVFQSHFLAIAVVTIFSAAVGFVLASFFIPKRYTSEALMYVENSASKSVDSSININDITAAQKLVNTCQILFTSDHVISELNDSFNGRYSVEGLKKMISISAVNNTEILKISVESNSSDESYLIAQKLMELSKDEFERVIKNGSIETVSDPTYPLRHNYPSALKFTVIAVMIGFALSYFSFMIVDMTDIKVKAEDDLAQMYNIPVFAEILDFQHSGNKGKYYSNYSGYDSYGYSADGDEPYDDIAEK